MLAAAEQVAVAEQTAKDQDAVVDPIATDQVAVAEPAAKVPDAVVDPIATDQVAVAEPAAMDPDAVVDPTATDQVAVAPIMSLDEEQELLDELCAADSIEAISAVREKLEALKAAAPPIADAPSIADAPPTAPAPPIAETKKHTNVIGNGMSVKDILGITTTGIGPSMQEYRTADLHAARKNTGQPTSKKKAKKETAAPKKQRVQTVSEDLRQSAIEKGLDPEDVIVLYINWDPKKADPEKATMINRVHSRAWHQKMKMQEGLKISKAKKDLAGKIYAKNAVARWKNQLALRDVIFQTFQLHTSRRPSLATYYRQRVQN